MPTTPRRVAVVLAAVTMLLMLSGCDRPDYESPVVNQEGPVIDIARLPDIDQTTAQMNDLIERIRAEVTRLVPASEPWTWSGDESGTSCVQESTGQKGVRRYLRDLESKHAFSDAEWDIVFPAVRQLATDAGLTDIVAPQNEPGNHDMRFSSGDGRTLMFGSRAASVISGTIGCRARAGEGA
jgi:hypothetical protein